MASRRAVEGDSDRFGTLLNGAGQRQIRPLNGIPWSGPSFSFIVLERRAMKVCLLLMLFCLCASAQFMDLYLTSGPSFARTQVLGGTNITIYGSTGYTVALGDAFKVTRDSKVSLWVEAGPLLFTAPSAETATIPGSITLGSDLSLLGVRLMAPPWSRISIFGAAGGGVGTYSNANLTSDNPPDLKSHNVTHGVFDVGGGLDFRLSRHFSLRLDVRDYVSGRHLGGVNGRNQVLPMLGLALHL